MINQYDVIFCLEDELPQISRQLYLKWIRSSVYTSIQHLAEYTRECAQMHQLHLAGKCLELAERFYDDGDDVVKNAIENIFMDSLGSFMRSHHKEEIMINAILPPSLEKLLQKYKKLNNWTVNT